MLKPLQKGSAVQNPGLVKSIAVISSAIIPALLGVYAAVYAALSDRYDFAVTVDEAGLIASALLGLVCAGTTVISSDKIGLPQVANALSGISEEEADKIIAGIQDRLRRDDTQ